MVGTGVAFALGAWAYFGWTVAAMIAVAAGVFGLAAILKIRPQEARIYKEIGIHDAARALRRAFVGDRRRTDVETTMRITLVPRPSSRDAGTAAAIVAIPETPAPNTDETIVEPGDSIAAALREAFDAGRTQKAQELKAMMAAYLDLLVSPDETRSFEPPRVPLLDSVAPREIADRTKGAAAQAHPPTPTEGTPDNS